MSRLLKSPDRILDTVETYWSPRARLLRALKRWEGPATSCELLEACEVGPDDAVLRNTYHAALGRLLASGHVTRTRINHSAMRARGIAADAGGIAQYDYRLAAVAPAPHVRVPPRCSECGERGHYVRTCMVRWQRARSA